MKKTSSKKVCCILLFGHVVVCHCLECQDSFKSKCFNFFFINLSNGQALVNFLRTCNNFMDISLYTIALYIVLNITLFTVEI